jgi:hypothetical protein
MTLTPLCVGDGCETYTIHQLRQRMHVSTFAEVEQLVHKLAICENDWA